MTRSKTPNPEMTETKILMSSYFPHHVYNLGTWNNVNVFMRMAYVSQMKKEFIA